LPDRETQPQAISGSGYTAGDFGAVVAAACPPAYAHLLIDRTRFGR